MKQIVIKNPVFRFFNTLVYYVIAVPILTILTKTVFGLKVQGRSNFRKLKGSGAVVVCNHVHNLDCAFLGVLNFPRKNIYTSMEVLFSQPVGGLIRILGSVPVPASLSGMRRFIDELTEAVHSGRLVCIYPEGELIPYCDQLREFKDGAFTIAVNANVPVVPVIITARERKGLWRILKRQSCLTITACEPIYADMSQGRRPAVQSLKAQAFRSMSEVQNRNKKKSAAVKQSA